MKGRKRYSIGAGVADFYFCGIVLGALSAVLVAATHRPIPVAAALMMSILTIGIAVIYHAVVAPRVQFLSLGEIMMGRVVTPEGKRWTNPYGINRGALFAFLFIALIDGGNAFDGAANADRFGTLTFPVVAGRIAILAVLFVGIALVGRANLVGTPLVAGYFLLNGISAMNSEVAGVSPTVMQGYGWLCVSAGIVMALLGFGYYQASKRKPEPTPEVTETA